MALTKPVLVTVALLFLRICPYYAFQLGIPSSSTTTHQRSSFQQVQIKGKQHHRLISQNFGVSPCSKSISNNMELQLAAADTDEKLSKEEKAAADKERLFWLQQARLAQDMAESVDKDYKAEQSAKYQERLFALVSDSVFFSILIFSMLWLTCASPSTPFSYFFGALLGTAYTYGLGKYVGTIGGSIDDEGAIAGAGVGQARFAFLILLFIFVGKFRSQGLQELPTIGGFFTYQLASLSQGLKEYDD
mmetsp:Transcript_1759/g.2455  ORF Transcript_1759/g.2455 Transcript_1759/m.2455 type:complete len:247 (-) Transcript_1759:68-808(-)